MRKSLFICLFFMLCAGKATFAQLSEGGFPRRPVSLKTAFLATEIMPPISNDLLRWQCEQEQQESGKLKPFTFAHAFEVKISPLTNGTWMRSEDGWWIWQIRIRSDGALSLNLLFEKFKLPDKARLFIFIPEQQQILGAFTKKNNSPEGIFQVSPLPGDEIVVQYETTGNPESSDDFVISRVNHDFIGILKYVDVRRPIKVSGACNIDVNCKVSSQWKNVQNSVCRIMVLGRDLCSGTLINNTSQNSKPYVLTADHCIDSQTKANGTLFLFNYESPYCGSLDGDVSNSLSGSKLKANFDSLDFALVEMTTPPPPSFRPYYAGWSRSTQTTDTMACIHHPWGDIKKISVDYNVPIQTTFISSFVKNAFWKTLKWDEGTTEDGSSGGPYFNREGLLVGNLSGGDASCSNPVNDYFARFDLAWNYKSDSSKQLKYWLDPAKTNPVTLKGKQFNEGVNLCGAYTNLVKGDTHQLLRIKKSTGENGGFWSGSNSEGIKEIAEVFSIPGKEQLFGVSLGVGKKYQRVINDFSYISIKIYDFKKNNASLIYSYDSLMIKTLVQDAMNLVKFKKVVEPVDTFLVAVNLEHVIAVDTLAFYQSLRTNNPANSFLINKNGNITSFVSENKNYTSALAFELIACNVGDTGTDTIIEQDNLVMVYPNPASSIVQVRSKYALSEDMVSVYNLLGQKVRYSANPVNSRQIEINLQGNTTGIYIVRVKHDAEYIFNKILLIRAE